MFLNIPVVSNRGIKIQSEKSSNKNQRNNKNTDRKLNNNLLRLCKFYARPHIESQNRMLNFKSHIICITEKQEGVARKQQFGRACIWLPPQRKAVWGSKGQQLKIIFHFGQPLHSIYVTPPCDVMRLRAWVCVRLTVLIAGISVCSCNMKTLPQILLLLQHART